jgi:CRP/FNR family transcriptional regulator, anaerobic regulatory protein
MNLKEALTLYEIQNPDIEQVMAIFDKKIRFKKGDFFIEKGQVIKGMAFVEEGAFRHFYSTQNGDEIDHWFTLIGSFLTTFESFTTQKPTQSNIQALKDSEVVFASKKDWDKLLSMNQNIKDAWHKSVEQLLIQLEKRIHNFIVFNGEQRYDWMYQNNRRIIEEIPDKYMASMLGITPRHLSRLRAKRK